LKVTFLGTGSSLGVPVVSCDCKVCLSNDSRDKRLRTSVLIETDGLTLAVDISPDFRYQALRAKISRVDAVLLTHEHRDHIAGLDDLRVFNYRQSSAIKIYASVRVREMIETSYKYIFVKEKYPGIPDIDFTEIDDNKFRIFQTEITPVKAIHYKTDAYELPVTGFRIGVFSYLTDIKYITEVELEKVMGSKVLVLSTLRKEEHYSHLNIAEALKIVDQVKPQKAYFTHISHLLGKHTEVEAELPENVFLAYDGLELII
jgi:phosphoribosyl 1,2-cyclic phosphate phosphodiesterase